MILSGTVVRNDVKIGKHCLLNSKCSIDHNSVISDFASCGPGVVGGGNIFLGKSSFVGIGCTIRNSIKIKDNVYIGAHSYVNKNCEKGYLYYGNPIKKIKKGSGNEYQLTDAISLSNKTKKTWCYNFSGKRYDCGSKLGYLNAQIAAGLIDKDIKKEVKNMIKNWEKSL